MIINKKTLYLAIILLIISMTLNFPFPHKDPYGETIALILNIPVRSVDGLHYVGITSLILLLSSLFFLTKSVRKYHGRVVLLAIIIAIAGPPFIASSYQKTLATGIYAIAYESELSNCQFDMIDSITLRGKCNLTFENYNRHNAQFTVEFYEEYYFEDDIRMMSLMNNSAPYEVTLEGNEKKTVSIETDIDVSNMENHIEHGSATFINLIIKSGGNVRKL